LAALCSSSGDFCLFSASPCSTGRRSSPGGADGRTRRRARSCPVLRWRCTLVLRFGTAAQATAWRKCWTSDDFAAAHRLHSEPLSMNSEICLQKSRRAGARRALLVIAVVGAWTVSFMGFMQTYEADAARSTDPRIEQRAPEKPHYIFMVETPV